MIDVTARMEGTGASPQCLAQLRAASATGSKSGRREPYSEDRRLRVRAPHLLQRLDHLALRGVRASAVQQGVNQIAFARGGPSQRGERALHLRAVPARAGGLQPADLLALERWVDAQGRRLAVVALGVAVHADHDLSAVVDALLQLERGVGDLALRVVALDRLHHAAERVDLAE